MNSSHANLTKKMRVNHEYEQELKKRAIRKKMLKFNQNSVNFSPATKI